MRSAETSQPGTAPTDTTTLPHDDARLTGIVGASVRIAGVPVGEVVGVYVDHRRGRAIGLEVASAGGIRRFLPWVAARFGDDTVAIDSPFFLVDDGRSYERLGAQLVRGDSALDALEIWRDGSIDDRAGAGWC